MTLLPTLKTTIRAVVVGVVLAGTSLAALPAAQAAPSFSFSFGTGGGYHVDRHHDRSCLSDPQVRRLLQRQGYDHIRFTDRRGRIVSVRAEKGHRDYRVTVDSCRGRIINVDRIRRR